MKYLFRLDMAKDNEEFLALRRARQVDHVYSGTPMKVGPGWIPDFVEIVVDAESSTCQLTLIELEATEIPARASCRKYLPESSSDVLRAFHDYLDTVISECRSTADSRIGAFEQLRVFMTSCSTVAVHTAGALRTSADFLEDLPLMDQPEFRMPHVTASAESPSSFSFRGERRFTRAESEGVRRAIRLLHAVVIGRDHSGGTMKSWRNLRQKPLENAASKESARYPELHKLLTSQTKFGFSVNCDKLAAELALLWRGPGYESLTPDRTAAIITSFYPVAASIARHEPMQNVFDRARDAVCGMGI
jgi:hypothetical protein